MGLPIRGDSYRHRDHQLLGSHPSRWTGHEEMLAGEAYAEGKDKSKPNTIMGSNAQVALKKCARYFELLRIRS